jgi:hypothetical protein
MWITADVELPMELIEAHAAGNLVLFVGAGASRNPPSGLPLFEQLAEQVGVMARRPYPGAGVAIDRFLGELLDGFDVHKHVKRLISRPDSIPNESHRALVRLAAAAGTTRIITTNFDDHLQTAADDAETALGDIYFSPALPVGRDFEGLVHLHGSISRPELELILTDHDFGRAYLTDAWATRFLREVFDHFVVLFVGFSHNDPIMNYLGMGLPSSTRRFILTDQAEDPRWKRLGITPVAYPSDDNHAAAARAIDEWAKRALMGRLDHGARIRDIVQGGPPKNPVETDYLSHMLEDPDGARVFAESASDASWLPWLEIHEAFSSIFKTNPTAAPDSALGEASTVLAQWFCDKYIGDVARQATALNLIQRTGQQLSPQLAAALPWAIRTLASKDPVAARRWTVLLTTSIAEYSAPLSLERYMWANNSGAEKPDLLLLRLGLRPYLNLRPDYWGAAFSNESGVEHIPTAEVSWSINEYAANEYWQRLKKWDVALDHRLCSLLENALLTAHELLDAWSSQGGGGGSLSIRRSAIEPHPQDKFREVIDVLIDGLRDCGQELIASDPGIVDRWRGKEYPLFRRLAVHTLGFAPLFDSSARIQWLLEHDLIFDYHTKHETYAVLAASVQDASPAVKSALLRRIRLGPGLDDEVDKRHTQYMKYNILTWLTMADTKWAGAATALDELQQANRDFAPRPHPDFDHWSESGVWGGTPPASAEEFARMIRDEGVDHAVTWLLNQDYSERDFDQPTWDDALGLLRSIAESVPSVALELWISSALIRDDRVQTMRGALTDGWSKADLSDVALEVVEVVASIASDRDAARQVSDFLLAQVDKQADNASSEITARLREIAQRLWEAHSASFTHNEEFNSVSLSLNSWPGRVSTYWVREIGRRWRSDPDHWAGLSDHERNALLPMLQGSGQALDATRPALAGEVFFLFAADPDFTVANVFPLFSNPGLERESWESYLYHPRWNNKFLERGFLGLIVQAQSRLEELPGNTLSAQYWGLLASVLTYSDITSEMRVEILDQLVLEQSGRHVAQFVDHLFVLLENQDTNEAAQSWDAWMGSYVQRRFDGQPRRPDPEELEAWADLVPLLGDRVPDGVKIVLSQGVGFRSIFRWDRVDGPTVLAHARPLAQYLIHRLQNSAQLSHTTQVDVSKVAHVLMEHLDSNMRERLVEAAAHHGVFLKQGER